KLPGRYNDAYHVAGDGVAVPVVRHLAATLLEPLAEAAGAPPRLAAGGGRTPPRPRGAWRGFPLHTETKPRAPCACPRSSRTMPAPWACRSTRTGCAPTRKARSSAWARARFSKSWRATALAGCWPRKAGGPVEDRLAR